MGRASDVVPEDFTVATMPARLRGDRRSPRGDRRRRAFTTAATRPVRGGCGRGPWGHALPAGLPQDARRAQAGPTLTRSRPTALGARPDATDVSGNYCLETSGVKTGQVTCGSFVAPRLITGSDGGGTTGPISPSGASSRSTITGAWSLGPVPLRAWRSTHAALTRPARPRLRAPGRSACQGPGGTSPPGSPSR